MIAKPTMRSAGLAMEFPVAADLVKMRFFAGMTLDEAAKALDIPRRNADRHWAFARRRTWPATAHRDGPTTELAGCGGGYFAFEGNFDPCYALSMTENAPADPAEHAQDFARRWAEKLAYQPSARTPPS